MKKILDKLNIAVILLVAMTLFSLTFPIFITKLTGEMASGTIEVKGFSLFTFSPWGYAVLFVPLALLVMTCFHDKVTHKYPVVLLLVFLGLFGHNACVLAAKDWIYGIADSFVRTMGQMLYYPMFLVASGFMLMMHMYDEDFLWDEDDWYGDSDDEWDPSLEEIAQEEKAA